jgi:hypothetical protein
VFRVSRLSPLVVAVAASALLAAGPAYATDSTKPIVGTPECTAAVNADPDVVAANVGSAGGLPAAKKAAEAKLCSPKAAGTTTTTTTTTATPPSTSTPPPDKPGQGGKPPSGGRPNSGNGPAGAPPNRPGRPAGDRDCPDFATQKDAQQYFESIGGTSTNNADRLDANHNGVACEDSFDDGDNPDAAVTSTGDDGSEATTSGDQVTDVPEGSAQTGGN